MQKYFFLIIFIGFYATVFSQIPSGYYNNAAGKKGVELQSALHDIIANHQAQSYASLWEHFKQTDRKSNGKVWDIYSDKPSGTPAYEYTFGTNQCGNYSKEGDCYNREHSFPKSWFNSGTPMYTDLFIMYPTDGYVNGRRSNFPYGEVSSATWTSTNGSKLGNCSTEGYNGTVFEPIDEYKGDIARTYFYFATRYFKEDNGWAGSPMVNGAQPKKWALDMLMQWHIDDPVSQKEIDRNNEVYKIQQNRNPFIDNPDYVDKIWGSGLKINLYEEKSKKLNVYPNPTNSNCTVNIDFQYNPKNITLEMYDILGKKINVNFEIEKDRIVFDLSKVKNGVYFLKLLNDAIDGNTYYSIITKI